MDDDDDNEDGDDDDPDLPHDPNDPNEEQPIHNISPHIEDDDPADENDQEPESDHQEDDDDERTINEQKQEQSTNNIEHAPNNQEDDEWPTNNDTGTRTIPNDPMLPPRVQRELNRLANDGIGPTIYQGWTRSETQQLAHNMSTTAHPESTIPLPYQDMTNFEKELFH